MSKDFKLEGVFPALVTPFKKNKEIDENAFRELINYVIDNVNGIVPSGTTGEFVNLSFDEQKKLIDIAVDEVNGKKFVIAGTGASSTKHAISLSKYAENSGADACLVVNPFFLHPSDKGIYEHFYRISRAVDLPIILYNIPQTTDSYIPRRVIEDLAEIDNIVGLKDSSGNLTYMLEVLEKVGNKINVIIGNDEVVLPALASGCKGMILASAQVFPEIWQEMYIAVKNGEIEKARELQMKVQKLTRIFCRYGGAVPIKATLKMLGINCGKTRKPLREGGALLREDKEEIRIELEKLGKVPQKEFKFEILDKPIQARFKDIGLSSEDIKKDNLLVGTCSSGKGLYKVHIDLVFGKKDSSIGIAFAVQLTHPRHGFEALTTILEPNLTCKPSTLIVPMIKLKNLRQANMVYGPVQNAVAKAVIDNVKKNIISKSKVDDNLMIIKVAVHPNAIDRNKLFINCYKAVNKAIIETFRGWR